MWCLWEVVKACIGSLFFAMNASEGMTKGNSEVGTYISP